MKTVTRKTRAMTEDKQFFILKRLAELDPMPSIIRAFKEEYGEDITIQTVRSYDPRDWHANKYAKENEELFFRIRQNLIDQVERIPIANRVYRVQELQRLYQESSADGDRQNAMRALEMSAKEVGGIYTNTRQIETTVSLSALSDADVDRRIIELCGGPENVPASLRSMTIKHRPELEYHPDEEDEGEDWGEDEERTIQ